MPTIPIYAAGGTGRPVEAGVVRVLAGSATMAADVVERWRDLGPALWIVAGATVALWFLLYGVLWAVTEPRRVRPGAATLELGGPEPPAVVNLLTNDWQLGHEAVPATLLDLAARGHLAIDQVGDQTLVRMRRRSGGGPLHGYERMVLDHVAGLAAEVTDGAVPSEALTTGPQNDAQRWWKSFRNDVVDHARALGVSRPRWSHASRFVLIVAAVVVGATVALALSATLRDDPNDSEDSPLASSAIAGLVAGGALGALAAAASGERDTPEGRASAARWLGLRRLLGDDPLLAEQPPAGVAIWDRHLAHGAALGVAHGAVAALPLGAESETEAWSPVGGRWRVVRIRYPGQLLAPGHGKHPLLVALWGAVELLFGLQFVSVFTVFLDVTTSEERRTPLTLIPVAVALLLAAPTLRGLSMLISAVVDLFSGRRMVEGRILRRKEQYKEDRVVAVWLAVDDGSHDRIRAWRLPGRVTGRPGGTVRGRVTRRLQHVRDLELPATAAGSTDVLAGGSTGLRTDLPHERWPAPPPPPGAAPAPPPPELAPAAGPVPPLPDPSAFGPALGLPLAADPDTRAHPLTREGQALALRGAGGERLQLAWIDPSMMTTCRTMPGALKRALPGLGDEAYRLRLGGAVVARRGPHVLLVSARLPGAPGEVRDRVTQAAAALAIDAAGRIDRTGEPLP